MLSPKKPFIIKLVEKLAVLRVGQTHTFVFNVQKCFRCAFDAKFTMRGFGQVYLGQTEMEQAAAQVRVAEAQLPVFQLRQITTQQQESLIALLPIYQFCHTANAISSRSNQMKRNALK